MNEDIALLGKGGIGDASVLLIRDDVLIITDHQNKRNDAGHCRYGSCSKCSCSSFYGSGSTCSRSGCGHHYDDHW